MMKFNQHCLLLVLWVQLANHPSYGFTPNSSRLQQTTPPSLQRRQARPWSEDEYAYSDDLAYNRGDYDDRGYGGDRRYYSSDRRGGDRRYYRDEDVDRRVGGGFSSRSVSPGNWDDGESLMRYSQTGGVIDNLSTLGRRRRMEDYGDHRGPPRPGGVGVGGRNNWRTSRPVAPDIQDIHSRRERYFARREEPLLDREMDYVRDVVPPRIRRDEVRDLEEDIVDDYVPDEEEEEEGLFGFLPRNPFRSRFRSNSYRSDQERLRRRRLEELQDENDELEEQLERLRGRRLDDATTNQVLEDEIERLEARMASLEDSIGRFTVDQRREQQDVRRETNDNNYRMENQMDSFVNSVRSLLGRAITNRDSSYRLPLSRAEFPEDLEEDLVEEDWEEEEDEAYRPRRYGRSARYGMDRPVRSMWALPEYRNGRGRWNQGVVRADTHMNQYPDRVAAYPETWR
mmetsp:Transcript_81796/g.229425  ORF Transcript_81796/g.229425 Transcript_81796/m.229425 type:complete len:455 (+) Transcript_81796:195-1559(+)